MQLDAKKFFLAFFFFIATLIVLGYYHFNREQKLINQNIDSSLQRAVESAHVVVGEDYHKRVLSLPPTEVEDADTIRHLTALARAQGVEYIYSLVLDKEGKLRFTSSSARNHELTNGKNLTHFFDTYPINEEMIKALKSNRLVWDKKERTDQWGKFRSVYLPGTTPSGQRFIIGADIEVGSIQKLSNAAAFKAIATSLVFFLGALPFLLIYRNALSGTADVLREKALTATDELREVNEILETKVEEKTKQLISQSFEDPLTSLPNRHQLQFDMDRHSYKVLLILNLRNFRDINDFFGFSIGNDLIRQMGHWLQTLDLNPYRLSGDEFVVLMEVAQSSTELEIFCQHLLHRLADHPFRVNDETVSLRVNIGIDMGSDICLAHADIALHQAKESRSHIAFYTALTQPKQQYQDNIALITTIHKALDGGRIICYYQPIVSLSSGRIEKYETLVRMIDESAQIIPPLDFLQAAKKTRLYPQITRSVITQACEIFMNRNEDFSVNLSIHDILDASTVRFIEETIVKTNTAHRIIFEVSESEGVENINAVIHFIKRMKRLGAKIGIDNYGIGYSNLENIVRFDIDYLKIDGSLINTIATNRENALLVRYISDLATKLEIKAIAQSVESEEIFNQIKTLGMAFAQGYYTGKPASLSL